MPCNLELKISKTLPECTFQHLKQIHALIITCSLSRNVKIFSKFLRRTTEFGTMDYSSLIFSQMGHGSSAQIVIWNAMIRGYAFNGPFQECIQMFDEMPHRGLKPHNFTYPYVINSCCELELYGKGKRVHCEVVKSGFESSYAVANSLLNMYLKMPASFVTGLAGNCKLDDALGEVANARDMFEKMPEKNVISWTSMIGAYADTGDLETARMYFETMPQRNVVSWNSMISSYAKHGKFVDSLNLFVKMQSEGVAPDGYTFVSVLSACSNLGDLEFGKYIHYLTRDLSRSEVMIGTALTEMYAQCGDVDKAFAVFIKIGKRDVFCWNVIIKALALHGRSEEAIQIFLLMRKTGLKPNDFTFTSALFACSHGGLVEEGLRIFNSMEKYYQISPKITHYACLIDMLCRNGQLEEAMLLVEDMPFKPDVAILGALLGGCRVTGDFKLAEKVVEKATELETNDSGVYVLLSNIHASAGQWIEAADARKKMDEKKISKKAGSSVV
ncbi:pentatricopeptide repeat-containing protein [Salix suchowensis]|nr:pentatricopeptide repeat-containing protein [Salix suchowensis]